MPPVGGTFVKEVLDRSSKARVSSASTPGEPRQCNSSADAVPTFPLSSPSVNASTMPLAADLQLKALSGLDLSSDAVGPAQQFDLAFSMATAIAGNEKDPEVQLKLLQDELASLQDFAPSHRQCKVEIAKLHRQNVQGTLHAAEQRNRRHMKLARDEMRRVQTHVGASSRVPAETRPPVPAPQTDAAAFVGDGRASVSFAQDVRAGCALPFCFNAYGTVGPNSLSSLSRTREWLRFRAEFCSLPHVSVVGVRLPCYAHVSLGAEAVASRQDALAADDFPSLFSGWGVPSPSLPVPSLASSVTSGGPQSEGLPVVGLSVTPSSVSAATSPPPGPDFSRAAMPGQYIGMVVPADVPITDAPPWLHWIDEHICDGYDFWQ